MRRALIFILLTLSLALAVQAQRVRIYDASGSTTFYTSFVLGAGQTLAFEGATSDAYQTTLTVVDPTADRTATFPDATGTVITSGNSSALIADETNNELLTSKGADGNVQSEANLTFDGSTLTLPANGAASVAALKMTGAPSAAGTTTTDFPLFLIEPTGATASTTWSDNGTLLGLNANLAQGNLIDAQVDGTSKFSVDYAGNATTAAAMTVNGALNIPGLLIRTNNANTLYLRTSGSTAGSGIVCDGGPRSNTSGSVYSFSITPTYNQASGTAGNTDLLISRTQTALGSGEQLFIDCWADTTTPTSADRKFSVSNTGQIMSTTVALTDATMTKSVSGVMAEGWSEYTWTAAMVVSGRTAATTSNVKVCTLPAKTVVRRAYIVTDAAATGVDAPTVSLGRTGAAYIDYVVASTPGVAEILGNAFAEVGSNLKNAGAGDAFVEDFAVLADLTSTVDVYCQFTCDGAPDIDQWAAATGTVYLETYTLP